MGKGKRKGAVGYLVPRSIAFILAPGAPKRRWAGEQTGLVTLGHVWIGKSSLHILATWMSSLWILWGVFWRSQSMRPLQLADSSRIRVAM